MEKSITSDQFTLNGIVISESGLTALRMSWRTRDCEGDTKRKAYDTNKIREFNP